MKYYKQKYRWLIGLHKQGSGIIALVLFCSAFAAQGIMPAIAGAAVQNPVAKPKISFTFDDGLASAATQAQPTLTKYGLTGTDYVITGCVGMSTTPNTCHANTANKYMTWAQIAQLQSAGWEIGSHTVTHPYLASSDATDGQPNVLTPTQVTQELTQSKADLAAHGIR
jgi:peptidoglycan/xylan/chitin deacetylase (PgdA/CDA1 family)